MNLFKKSGLILALSCGVAFHALADETAEKGRKVLEAEKDIVITVELVVKQKFSFGGGPSDESEMKIEATGTVIGEDGLTVVSLTETDPSALFENMMSGMGGGDFKFDSEIEEITMILADESEVDAEVILRDKDLDMAFVRPLKKPANMIHHANIASTVEVQHLDQVFTISRLGKVARRAHAIEAKRVQAIVEKPRRFYMTEAGAIGGVGGPAFTVDGEFIGVYFLRSIKSTGSSMGSMFGGAEDNIAIILVPAIDIQEAAGQAPPFQSE